MTDTRTDLRTAPVLTACPQLAAELVERHPGLRNAMLTRIAGIGTPPDCDGLLLLTPVRPRSCGR